MAYRVLVTGSHGRHRYRVLRNVHIRRTGAIVIVEELNWRKSSYSSESANCVEFANVVTAVHVRDSKAGNDGTVLRFEPDTWRHFTRGIKAGQVARP